MERLQINDHSKRLVGVAKLSDSWAQGENALDAFVSVRGDIAHQGRHANYVTIANLNTYRDLIRTYAVETDNAMAAHLKVATAKNSKPWNITT